jgi:hypothetical protein
MQVQVGNLPCVLQMMGGAECACIIWIHRDHNSCSQWHIVLILLLLLLLLLLLYRLLLLLLYRLPLYRLPLYFCCYSTGSHAGLLSNKESVQPAHRLTGVGTGTGVGFGTGTWIVTAAKRHTVGCQGTL